MSHPDPVIVEPLLTYRAAGKVLGVTERTVWALVARRKLPAVRFGRSVRIDAADLRSFIERAKLDRQNDASQSGASQTGAAGRGGRGGAGGGR